MTEYFVPRAASGRTEGGHTYRLFRGLHHLPDALANTHEANDLGIKPVEEMTDKEWAALGLQRDAWMKANRPAPEGSDDPGADRDDAQGRIAAALAAKGVRDDGSAQSTGIATTDAPKAS